MKRVIPRSSQFSYTDMKRPIQLYLPGLLTEGGAVDIPTKKVGQELKLVLKVLIIVLPEAATVSELDIQVLPVRKNVIRNDYKTTM